MNKVWLVRIYQEKIYTYLKQESDAKLLATFWAESYAAPCVTKTLVEEDFARSLIKTGWELAIIDTKKLRAAA